MGGWVAVLMASTSEESASSASTEEGRSQGSAFGLRCSGATNQVPSQATAMMGTLTRKSAPQWKWPSSQPPSSGPRMAPTSDRQAQTEMASARSRSSEKPTRMRARVAGSMAEAPTACSTRASTRTATEPA